MAHLPRPLLLLLAFGLAGCPPTPDDDDSAELPDRDVTLAGECDMAELWGAFSVEAQPLFGVVDGSVADGVVPVSILEELESSGDCTLFRRNNPFCDPACQPGFTCDHTGECIPFPENQDLGQVTVRGLLGEVAMDPVQPGNRYFATQLPNPPFEPAAKVLLDALSTPWGAIELEGFGVAPLVVPEDPLLVEEGEPMAVTWTASTAVPEAQVHLEFTIDQHGTSPVRVRCDFEDTGSAEVPAATIDALMGAGVSGWPNASLSRRTVDSAAIGEGCLELRVGSITLPPVRVAGHTPCNGPEDCPDGLTCDIPTNTCI